MAANQIHYTALHFVPDPVRAGESDNYSRSLNHGVPTPPNGQTNADIQPYQNLGYPWPGMQPLSLANNGKAYGTVGGVTTPGPILQAGGSGNDGRWGAAAIRAWLLGMRAAMPGSS